MHDLPESITSLAFRASNGELAWRRANVETALIAIRDTRQSILGGEVWAVNAGAHTWHGGIPQRTDGTPAVWHWETAPQTASESWLDYCSRTFVESMNAIRSMSVEEESQPDVIGSLHFNVTYIEETGE